VIQERLQPLLDLTRPLADRFSAAGYRLYLVGGIVRDLLAGQSTTLDLDLTTDALPDATKQIVTGWADAVWDQGARFGTVGLKKAGTVFEITTHRARACSARADSVGFPGRSGWQILSALIRFWERERCRRPTLLIFEVE